MTEKLLAGREANFAKDAEELQAFIRSLRRRQGFAIEFVQCTPNEVGQLLEYVRESVPRKKADLLPLPERTDNLYDIIAALPERENTDILFIQGIENSLKHDIKAGTEATYGGKGGFYNLDTAPSLLSHLNLQRERFQRDFNICFVFVVTRFALTYFIRRAPDFFDWRAGVYRLSERETERPLSLALGTEEEKIDEQMRELWAEGLQLYELGRHEEAIAALDRGLSLDGERWDFQNSRGVSLSLLGLDEEAIASFDRALEIKPDLHEAWYNRACSYALCDRPKEALSDLRQAIALNPESRDMAASDPDFESIRNDPEFQALVASGET